MTDYDIDLSECGVPRGEGETWGELVERRDGGRDEHPHGCCLCDAEYRSRRAAALRCCSEAAVDTQPTD